MVGNTLARTLSYFHNAARNCTPGQVHVTQHHEPTVPIAAVERHSYCIVFSDPCEERLLRLTLSEFLRLKEFFRFLPLTLPDS